ncbi:unnamed protein product [Oreochromis niloticus]|nr:unnamed protein product [Mustela putorius furo]
MTITLFNLAVVVFSFIMTGHLLFAILMISSHEYQVQALLPPTLTVSTAVISETDSVTLHCQAPAFASVHHCYFYTGEQQGNKGNSCLQTLTGTELLLMSHQRSPAEVKVRCFYTVKNGIVNSPSAHSHPSSITIQNILEKESPTTKVNSPCTMTTEFPKLKKPESKPTSQKKTSAESSLTTARASISTSTVDSPSEEVSRKTNTKSSFTLTTYSNKTDTTVKVEESLWNLAAAVTRYGIVVGFILLVLGLHIFKRRTGDFVRMRTINHGGSLPAGNDGGSSVILSVPGDNCLTIEENINLQQMKNENSDIYHVYATISEETDAPDSQDTI